MSTSNRDEIPTALPGLEDENEREQLLQAENTSPDTIDPEDEADDELEIPESSKKSRRTRALKAVAGLMIFFIVLFATVSWFFGIGMFSQNKPQPINRNARNETQAPVSEDEKLKMALSMVAAREPSSNVDTPDAGSEPAVPVAPQLGDQSANVLTSSDYGAEVPAVDSIAARPKSVAGDEEKTALSNTFGQSPKQPAAETQPEKTPIASKSYELSAGRSVFFGKERRKAASETERMGVSYREDVKPRVDPQTTSIPFGTLLPVRLTSAVYTFRNSGGFIRMELTRAIDGNGYSYPAGTAVIGSLRGAESTRVFVTVTGLIDPASGQVLKLGGELLGRDGASGILGRKRKMMDVWSRFLRGLRDTGSSIVGSIGSWRSGGTVVITNSMRKAGSDVPGLLNDKASSSSDAFVQVDAGSMGFVQVTGLPEELSKTGGTQRGTESGLTDEELADLFSGNSADKLRAALPRKKPELRRLAEDALKNFESK